MPFVLFGDDYDAVEIVTSKTSSTQDDNLNADDIFTRHDMINIISCIKQFKFIKPIKPKQEEQQPELTTEEDTDEPTITIEETYDTPLRTDYQYDQSKFEIVNVFKIRWLRNITKNGGAQQELLDQIQPGEIVIKSATKKLGQLWAIIPKNKLIQLTSSNHGIYEVLKWYPRKVYFDIDKTVDQEPTDEGKLYLEQNIIKLNEYFVNAKYSVSGSCDSIDKDKWKISFHIIINNYIVNNEKEFILLKELVKYLKQNFDDAFDDRVYSLKSQNFKCINQSKPDGRIQKIITNNDVTTHYISCYFAKPSYILPEFNIICKDEKLIEHIHDTRVKEKLDFGTLPTLKHKLALSEDFDIDNAKPEELLNLLPISPKFDHNYTHKIARFCFNSKLSFDTFYNWYRGKKDNNEAYNRWFKHWGRLDKFPSYNTSNIISILIFYYPKIKDLRRLKEFKNNCTNRPDNVNITIIETLDETHYKHLYSEQEQENKTTWTMDTINKNKKAEVIQINEIGKTGPKYNIMNIGMGSGKTEQTVNFLSKVNNFIWIAPNQALTSNTQPRINTVLKDTSKCKHYRDDFQTPDKKKHEMHKADKLIICLNSLHYLSNKKYDNIIIDEIDTFLHKWFDNSTIIKKSECWETFKNLIREAKNIIMLDAFTTNLTLNFINNIRKDQDAIQLYERESEVSDISVEHIESNMKWIYQIKESLINNKRIFIYYPYKDGNAKRKSMSDLRDFLEQQTGKRGILYNGDSDAETSKTLKNVNAIWSNYDFVLTNNKITVGVNYDVQEDEKIFDLVFVSLAGFSMPRDVVQASRRCRTTREKLIKITFFDSVNTQSDFHNDIYLYDHCPIYKQLQKDILIERYAPLKETFFHFFKKAGCTIINDNIPLHKKLKNN